MELPVSGPFHSSLMKPAAENLRSVIEKIKFSEPRVTYYSDIDAVAMGDPVRIAESLVRQLTAPVQWIQVIDRMVRDGITRFVEVGPGKVLSGLIKKISKDAQVLNVGDAVSLESLEKEP
jgi:[acyl-carrier-protein] S-malonyltransferase